MTERLPSDPDVLEKDVPGVGRYTAGAICSMAYGVRTPIVGYLSSTPPLPLSASWPSLVQMSRADPRSTATYTVSSPASSACTRHRPPPKPSASYGTRRRRSSWPSRADYPVA